MVGTQDPAPPASSVFRSTESAGPGLVFKSLPLAFAQMPLGAVWATVVFVLRFVAALTSAISLLEVSTSFAIDEWGVPRSAAALGAAALLFVIGIPSALSGTAGFFGAGLTGSTGRSWFDWLDHAASNWLLPIGGLAIAMFVSWRLDRQLRQPAFAMGTRLRSRRLP